MIADRAVLGEDAYLALRARYDAYEAARKRVCGTSNCVTADQAALLPAALTHEELSALEVYEFVADVPLHYFAYVQESSRPDGGYRDACVTTWPGEALGRAQLGPSYRANFGDTRVPVRVWARNGWVYSGVYYKSAGDYCRLQRTKQYHGVTDIGAWPVRVRACTREEWSGAGAVA